GEGCGCGCGDSVGSTPVAETPAADSGRCTLSADAHEVASLAYGEELRSDARSEIAALTQAGYEVHLLSGDTPDRVTEAAEALGIPAGRATGSLSPEDKAVVVRKLDARDTLMVGDGLNDGPSFAAAWTSATPAVDQAALPARADFYFLGGGIGAVRNALVLATRLRRVVRDNLILAGVYNVAALALCFAGVVTPVWAAVLMPISSAGVVSLTAARMSERQLRWK
ncbi:MAG TPA: HAD-IC family P-type ATPase, partial [bacterium]|nr:HAD-IC family P-type ATPase [bacterium]